MENRLKLFSLFPNASYLNFFICLGTKRLQPDAGRILYLEIIGGENKQLDVLFKNYSD
jgi:hypothetical protein